MTKRQERFDRVIRHHHQARVVALVWIVAATVIILVSFFLVDLFAWRRLVAGVPTVLRLLGQMLPPDFSRAKDWVEPAIDTIAMSIAGTAIAVLASVPLSLGGARNTAPHPLVYYATRSLLNLARAIPELILGMLLVAAVGFGKLPGTLALGLHSIGMVAKFFAEAIERANRAPIEAIRAVGASELQAIAHGIYPQIAPQIMDVTLYRWEYNFRASLVMGAVGAGGIGSEIISALRILQYAEVAALLLIVLGMVAIVDGCSNVLRKRLT